MQTYFIVGAIVAVLGVVVWAAVKIRSDGKNAQRVDDLQKATTIKDKQLVEANKPRDPNSIVDAARKGEF